MRAYERLLKYVKVYTTSDPNSGTHPSTMRQFDLAHQLVQELKDLGLADARVDEHCYVYATLPATPGSENAKPLGLIAHMDTTDDAPGENVNAIDKMPQIEGLKDDGVEILYFTEEVDEFCAQILHAYKDKEFRSVLDQEIEEGDAKRAEEAGLQAWIDSDPSRMAKWGSLLHDLDSCYSASEEVERNKTYYRETLVRGTIIVRTMMRMNAARGDYAKMKEALDRGMSETDPRVEKELLQYAVQQYFENVDSRFFGPFQKELLSRFGQDYGAMTDYVWEGTCVASAEAAAAFASPEQFASDRLRMLLLEVPITAFNNDSRNNEYRQAILNLQREYTRALYEKRLADGVEQYPDANSTMRISYGTVGPLSPRDGVQCHWQSFSSGIEQKYDPAQRDYRPSDRFMGMIRNGEWGRWAECCGRGPSCDASVSGNAGPHRKSARGITGGAQGRNRRVNAGPHTGKMPVNFLTDNDITGGNSGSPVLDSRGRLIGLAFDGNKESLASDVYWTPGYNKCVNVDIRFVLWTLENYAHCDNILAEIGQK